MSSLFITITAVAEALGHPDECVPTVNGEVQQRQTHGVTTGGQQFATVASADIHFPSHSHTYDTSCTDDEAHDIDPGAVALSSSVTINGSPIYEFENPATTDPTSGGNVNFLDTGTNSSVTETP